MIGAEAADWGEALSWGHVKKVSLDDPEAATDSREVSYSISSSLVTADRSTAELPGPSCTAIRRIAGSFPRCFQWLEACSSTAAQVTQVEGRGTAHKYERQGLPLLSGSRMR